MNRCGITLEMLLDYREGRSGAVAAESLRMHLATGCSHCERTLGQLERTVSVLAEAERDHAPETVLERVKALYRERFRQPERRSLIASLLPSRQSGIAFAGARGESSGATQLFYQAEDFDLDIWAEREPDGTWYLIGQVISRSQGQAVLPVAVTLTCETQEDRQATFEGEECHLSGVTAGTYALLIHFDDCDILIPQVTVGG